MDDTSVTVIRFALAWWIAGGVALWVFRRAVRAVDETFRRSEPETRMPLWLAVCVVLAGPVVPLAMLVVVALIQELGWARR